MKENGHAVPEISGDKGDIAFITGDARLLDEVQGLWEELNQIHLEKSVDFKNHYRTFTFQARKESLLRHGEKGKLLVIIAQRNDRKIGYCIASLADGAGEIDSIFVKPGCRKSAVGNSLMELALDWMQSNAAQKITVKVAVGNEAVFGFYAKYGFAPRLTELQIVDN